MKKAEKIYKSNPGALIRNYILQMIYVATIILMLAGAIALIFSDRGFEIMFSPAALIIYGLLIIAIPIYRLFFIMNLTLKIRDKNVIIYRRNKEFATFSSDEYYFSSFVHREINEGGKFTSRYLRVTHRETGWFANYLLFLSRKKFEQFIAVSSSFNKDEVVIKEAKNDFSKSKTATFTINKEQIKQGAKKKCTASLLWMIAICSILFILYIIWAINNAYEAEVSLAAAATMVIIFLSLPIIVIAITTYKTYLDKLKYLPREIRITKNEIIIDQDVFNFNDIELIRLTPPNYDLLAGTGVKRMMTITYRNNQKFEYLMGFRRAKHLKNMSFDGYDEMVELLSNKFINNPEKFILDL